jgi:hypothetical protein
MDDWSPADTNTHQDHVIAHVIGATVEAYFVWDETVYLVLDIGFIWNIYLNIEMGLVPQVVAIAELDASDEMRRELRSDLDLIGRDASLNRMTTSPVQSPILSIDFLTADSSRQLRLTCEEGVLVVETSLQTAEVKIYEAG